MKEEDNEDGVVDVIARSPSPAVAALIDKGTSYGPFPASVASSDSDGELVTTVSARLPGPHRFAHSLFERRVDIYSAYRCRVTSALYN